MNVIGPGCALLPGIRDATRVTSSTGTSTLMKSRIIPEKVFFDFKFSQNSKNFLKIVKIMVHFKVLPPLIPPPLFDFFNHNLAGGLGMPLVGARGVPISATAVPPE